MPSVGAAAASRQLRLHDCPESARISAVNPSPTCILSFGRPVVIVNTLWFTQLLGFFCRGNRTSASVNLSVVVMVEFLV